MPISNLVLGLIALTLHAPQNQERILNDNNEPVFHQFSGSEVTDISTNEYVHFPFV